MNGAIAIGMIIAAGVIGVVLLGIGAYLVARRAVAAGRRELAWRDLARAMRRDPQRGNGGVTRS